MFSLQSLELLKAGSIVTWAETVPLWQTVDAAGKHQGSCSCKKDAQELNKAWDTGQTGTLTACECLQLALIPASVQEA